MADEDRPFAPDPPLVSADGVTAPLSPPRPTIHDAETVARVLTLAMFLGAALLKEPDDAA